MGFSSVPRLSGWYFQQLICGGVPPASPERLAMAGRFTHLPASGGISPTDKLRKDSALTPVTSEKATLFIGVTKTVRFCKALNVVIMGDIITSQLYFRPRLNRLRRFTSLKI